MAVWPVAAASSRRIQTSVAGRGASGFDENFERQWRVPERAGVDYGATGCAVDSAAKRLPGPRVAQLGCAYIHTLDMHRHHAVFSDPSDRPEHPLAAHRVADRRNGASAEVVLEVTIREADNERSYGHRTPRRSTVVGVPLSFGRKTTTASRIGRRYEMRHRAPSSCLASLPELRTRRRLSAPDRTISSRVAGVEQDLKAVSPVLERPPDLGGNHPAPAIRTLFIRPTVARTGLQERTRPQRPLVGRHADGLRSPEVVESSVGSLRGTRPERPCCRPSRLRHRDDGAGTLGENRRRHGLQAATPQNEG